MLPLAMVSNGRAQWVLSEPQAAIGLIESNLLYSSYDGNMGKKGFVMRTSKSDTVGGCRNPGQLQVPRWIRYCNTWHWSPMSIPWWPAIRTRFPRRVAVWKRKGTFWISEGGRAHQREAKMIYDTFLSTVCFPPIVALGRHQEHPRKELETLKVHLIQDLPWFDYVHLPSDQRENPSIFQSISQGRGSFNSYMIIVSQGWRLPNSRCFSGFPTFSFSSYLAAFTYDLGGIGGEVSGVLRVELDSYSAL